MSQQLHRVAIRSKRMLAPLLIMVLSNCSQTATGADDATGSIAPPLAVPTFHCIGLYWTPAGGEPGKEVAVRFRAHGLGDWQDGLPMRYNPIARTDRDLADYRGSIVHLATGTEYEVELTLEAGTSKTLRTQTWSDEFPVGETIRVGDRRKPLTINESGTPDAWRVYDGSGGTIDLNHRYDTAISVNASHVILRGLTLRGAGKSDPSGKSPIGAIRIEGGHDIVVEDCDISDWGRLNGRSGFGFNQDSAIYCNKPVKRLVIQRCKLHHPTFDGSSWHEPTYPTHTRGPQCITLVDTTGNHVIRYNECSSDMEHMFNDIIGGASNGSFRGAPGPDSDVYGNYLSHSWDDALEIEGGNRNTRVWGNYITQSAVMVGNAATSIGPLYIWGNVCSRSQWRPNGAGGYFVKMGYAGGEHWMTGRQYIFHNTLYRSDDWLPTGALGGNRIIKHTTSRNNLLHVRRDQDKSISTAHENVGNDFDFDLYNGVIPQGHERHGVRGTPMYDANAGFCVETKTGRFQLSPASPGAGAGRPIPNFTGWFDGDAPDSGAHQRGAPPMRFGVNAGRPSP